MNSHSPNLKSLINFIIKVKFRIHPKTFYYKLRYTWICLLSQDRSLLLSVTPCEQVPKICYAIMNQISIYNIHPLANCLLD